MSSVGLCSAIGTDSAQPLFSQIQTSGSFQTDAWSAASWNVPREAAPSPKKMAVTRSVPSMRAEMAAPAPSMKLEPSVPPWPSTPTDGSTKCAVPPPLPPVLPVTRPKRSPKSSSTFMPLATA